MNTQPKRSQSPVLIRTLQRNAELPPARSTCTRKSCLPQLFAAAAAANPNASALQSGAKTLSYGEMDRRAGKLAEYLTALGVGPESVLGIELERSFDYVVAALAIWKAVGAYLYSDLAWPEARREFVIKGAGAAVTIGKGRAVDLVRDRAKIAACDAVSANIRREDLAYVIHTSGSTGQPKGVEVTRQDNRHLAFGWAAHFCFGAPLARMEGQIAFSTLLGRLPRMTLATDKLVWRENLGLRGLKSLPVRFEEASKAEMNEEVSTVS